MIHDDAPARKPWWVRCQPCGHAWVACYVPIPLTRAATILKNGRCPKCCSTSKQHFVYEAGRTPDGVADVLDVTP